MYQRFAAKHAKQTYVINYIYEGWLECYSDKSDDKNDDKHKVLVEEAKE